MLWVCAPADTKAQSLDTSSAANTPRSSAKKLRGRNQCTFSLANRRHIAVSLPMLLSPVDRLLAERAPQLSQAATRERARAHIREGCQVISRNGG